MWHLAAGEANASQDAPDREEWRLSSRAGPSALAEPRSGLGHRANSAELMPRVWFGVEAEIQTEALLAALARRAWQRSETGIRL